MVLVTADGRYHGHVASKEAALNLPSIKGGKEKGHRLLTDKDWDKVVENPGERASLCESLGEKIS